MDPDPTTIGRPGDARWSFAQQPPAARAYVAGVTAVAVVMLVVQPAATGYGFPLLFLTLLAAAAAASVFRVELPLSQHSATMSLSFAFELAALLLLGAHAATVIAASGAWMQCTTTRRERNPLYRTAFSMAAVVVSTLTAGAVFAALGGHSGSITAGMRGFETPAIAAATTYFVLNTLLVAVAVGLETHQPARRVWNEHAVWSALGFVVGTGVAALGVLLLLGPNGWLAPVLLIPLALIHRTYSLYVDRVDAEERRVQQISDLHLATVEALALAIDAKDQTTTSHLRRVQAYATGIAEAMGLTESEIQGVRTAALLHDIGKLAVPEHILSKPGPLTPEEFQRIKTHPVVGAEIIANVPFPYPVAPLILCHHERWDGKGYPNGLAGAAIPLGARILAAVDYFDALRSDRPFHRATPIDEAIKVIESESGRALDPQVVETLMRLLPSLEAAAAAEAGPNRTFSFVTNAPGDQLTGAADLPLKNVFQDIALAHREIYTLYEIAQSMGTSLGVADTMGPFASKLSNLVPLTSCALFLYEESANQLRCRFATGVDAELLQTLTIPQSDGLVGWVGRNKRALVNARPIADFEAAGAVGQTSLKSALICPLVFDDRLIGTLAVYHTEADCYTDDHRRLLERVAEQAAGVVHNATVFEQTKRDSLTDPLTGLPNTRYMFLHLSRELARAERLGSEVSVLVMDLDKFKDINDSHGHHVGDRALREVARVLRNGIRPYDICVRYAGDEFVVVLSGCGAGEAEQKRQELQQAIDAMPFEVRPGRVERLGCSFGVAVFPHDGAGYESLLAVADKRMYKDKGERKARVAAAPERGTAPTPSASVFAKIPQQVSDRTH